MNIILTREQYETILELVYMGTWVMSSLRDGETGNRFEEAQAHLFSWAGAFGLEGYGDYDPDLEAHFPSREFEVATGVIDRLNEYEEGAFWDRLALELARRDLSRQHGAQALRQMPANERLHRKHPLIARYREEFASHGVENLVLSPPVEPAP